MKNDNQDVLENTEKSNTEIVLPDKILDKVNKALKPSKTRSLAFETDKERNLGNLRKGLQKPGFISYDILRRACNAVPVARVCVNSLKEKITKTKWVIKNKDPMAKEDESQIETITNLLRTPNPNDTFRSLMDKMLEDLLVLDSVAVEKTRYPNGELAQLFYVDAATIRPVFDEYGNQDIEIDLKTKEGNQRLPVSYLQVMDNSPYGGPESGEIVGAWPKKDMIYFHMHPQGTMENYGYGLSPLEGVLSVVNNLLNSDNFNGSYFDEGAFPPLILQLAGQLDQRNLEAYREYLYAEIEGNFHRPAIMAGGGEMKIHNLKEMTNRDMQFMEYTQWLSKLLSAAYGLSPQDIGITDDVNRATSMTMKQLSESKGYGSILNLIKEVINEEIIRKDFGFNDLEFAWIEEDALEPETSMRIYDTALKNGTMTLNEVREKLGLTPYEDWADQAMILKGDGYAVIHTDEHEESSEESEYGAETVYNDTEVKKSKSMSKAVYTDNGYKTWFDDRGYGQPFIFCNILTGAGWVIKPPVAVNLNSQKLECEITQELHESGYNVNPVQKMTLKDIMKSIITDPIVKLEFDKYINMTSEYDSEKWRAKNGGSRKFPYYLVSKYIDGFPLSSKVLQDDMKRDPDSYKKAIEDLAELYNIEKKLVLGDRRIDQYIITPDKRAFGFDYQFKGDKARWESSSMAIEKVLSSIPELHSIFIQKTSKKPTAKKSIVNNIVEKLKGKN